MDVAGKENGFSRPAVLSITTGTLSQMAVNVPALLAVVFFYIVIVAIGFWAFRKSKEVEKTLGGSKAEITIVGGRNINVPVGILTLTGRKTIFLVRHDALFGPLLFQ